ncbi:MAG: hypothetical protein ABI831_14870 [Betaproteobacteria bacterium]
MTSPTGPGIAQLPRPFHHLAWSNLAAQSAEQISLAAAPMIAVLALDAGPAATGMGRCNIGIRSRDDTICARRIGC